MKRKVTLFIAMSLDGYIAKDEGNIDFLSIVDSTGEDYGYADFIENVDAIIWGRKTFDKVLSFGNGVPHKDKKVFVISKSKTGKESHAEYCNDIVALINTLKSQPGKDIYCDGGGEVVYELLNNKLIDRIIVSVIPHLVGSGIRLFKEGGIEQDLKFKRSITYPSGLVQLWYDLKHSESKPT